MAEEYSKYYSMSPDETVRAYMKKLNKRKTLFILADAAVLFVMISVYINNDGEVLSFSLIFLLCILAVLGFGSFFRAKNGNEFTGLLDILTKDCDPVKYQAVIELLMKKDRYQKGKMRFTLEYAMADYYRNKPAEALERIAGVAFKSPKNVFWIRKYNIEALCRHEVGDFKGRDECVERLERFRLSYKAGTANRQIMDNFMMGLHVAFKPFDQWGTAEKAFAEQKIVLADNRLIRMCWQLRQAEYELLYGDREKAEHILAELEGAPSVPGIQAWIGQLKKIRERKEGI